MKNMYNIKKNFSTPNYIILSKLNNDSDAIPEENAFNNSTEKKLCASSMTIKNINNTIKRCN